MSEAHKTSKVSRTSKAPKKKLALSRESLRKLTSADLKAAAGGNSWLCDGYTGNSNCCGY